MTGHPNVVNLKEGYEDHHYVHLIMELCTGGHAANVAQRANLMRHLLLWQRARRDAFVWSSQSRTPESLWHSRQPSSKQAAAPGTMRSHHEHHLSFDQLSLQSLVVLIADAGGELVERIMAKGQYTEKDAALVTRKMLKVCCCSSQLKPARHSRSDENGIVFAAAILW
jgi:hypothetical protein